GLRQVGIERPILAPAALDLLASVSVGLPRLLNLLARTAWLSGRSSWPQQHRSRTSAGGLKPRAGRAGSFASLTSTPNTYGTGNVRIAETPNRPRVNRRRLETSPATPRHLSGPG